MALSRPSLSVELSSIPSSLPAAVTRPESIDSSQLDGPLSAPENGSSISSEALTRQDIEISRIRGLVIIATVVSMTFLNSLLFGLLTVALPRMARDLDLAENLLFWPASVYALTSGCTLLLSGSLADVVGTRPMYLTGCGLYIAFTLGCGLARTGIQLIMFRAFQGIAISFCLPSAVSIITGTFPTGQRRNVAFASLGAGQPLGFSVGLVLGGVLVDSIGWRYGYFMGAIANALIFVGAVWGLPKQLNTTAPVTWKRLAFEIDWVGAFLASGSLGMLSYVFAMVTAAVSNLRAPLNITLLCVALVLLPAFVLWVGRQERLMRPAIIPNSLWKNTVFTCICITVFLTWAVFNVTQYLLTLYFQEVQELSALQTSLRFLPMVVSGCLTNIGTGLLVQRVSANWLVFGGSAITAASPLIMCFIHKDWPYWYGAFLANLLSPISADVLFTVSNLLITSVFPSKTHGLAGGVFNTLSQIGNSVGLAVAAVIATTVTASSPYKDKHSPDALLQGYRATFWACFGTATMILGVVGWGLRNIGRVGLKQD